MYKPSPLLSEPKNSLQTLWRYLSPQRLLDLLSTGELFFAHLPVLGDKYEGMLTARTRERFANWFRNSEQLSWKDAYSQVEVYQKHRERFYVNCWHANNHESYLMWKVYADRGFGFAIKTTFERVKAALDISQTVVHGGLVKYVDYERGSTDVGNVFNHVAIKDLPYSDEHEFRLIFWEEDPSNDGHPKTTNGVRVPVRIDMLVREVVRNPYHKPLDSEIERLLEHHGIGITNSAISIKPDSSTNFASV